MEKSISYKQTLGIISVLAGIVAAVSIILAAVAVDFNFEVFGSPAQVLNYAHHAVAAYWFLLFDLMGYYLLLLPVIFYLHQQYKYHSPWVPLLTFSGLSYVFTGAIGAAILASTWPELMRQHIITEGVEQQQVAAVFNTVTLMVTKGLWNILEMLFAGIWWVGYGLLLRRDRLTLGWLSIVAGAACLLDAVGTIAGWAVMAEAGVNIYLLLGIIWPMVLGVQLVRKSDKQVHASLFEKKPVHTTTNVYAQA